MHSLTEHHVWGPRPCSCNDINAERMPPFTAAIYRQGICPGRSPELSRKPVPHLSMCRGLRESSKKRVIFRSRLHKLQYSSALTWCVRIRNLDRALYLWVMRAENGALRIFVHSDRRCAAPDAELHWFSAQSRLSSMSASCKGRKKSGQVSFAVPLGDMESSCRSNVELSVRLLAVKEWWPLKPDGPVN